MNFSFFHSFFFFFLAVHRGQRNVLFLSATTLVEGILHNVGALEPPPERRRGEGRGSCPLDAAPPPPPPPIHPWTASFGEGHNSSLAFHLFYLGRSVAPTWQPPPPTRPPPRLTGEGWPPSHGRRLTLLFMAAGRQSAAPEGGNIAHLAGLLGGVTARRTLLYGST